MRISALGTIPLFGQTAPRSSFLRHMALTFAGVFVLCFSITLPTVAQPQQAGAPALDISVIPKPINDTFERVQLRDLKNDVSVEQKTIEINESCLLPPLNLVRSPVVAATALAVPGKAKEEYREACTALRKKNNESAEKHLRKAVKEYPRYSLAWVTLGQMLAAQNHTAEARSACSQGSTAEPNYVPAYLCLADLAAQEKAWGDVLQLSNSAIQLDPVSTAIAFEYNAAANLRTNKLDDAEKSALRALEIDQNHSDPRVHFVLAQIYEAKGDRANEVVQLREYLKFAVNSDDMALVKRYLSQLERSAGSPGEPAAQKPVATLDEPTSRLPGQKDSKSETAGASATSLENRTVSGELGRPAPGGISSTCNLDEVLPQVEGRIQESVDNLQKFTATESLLQESFNESGKVARSERWNYNYIVSIEDSVPGILAVNEYQNSRSSVTTHPDVVPKGLPALLLIFHPYYAGDFSMYCEGLTTLDRKRTWQVRFRQREDKPNRIRSYQVGVTGRSYEVALEGRAWFMENSYQIVKLDANLIKAIPEIQLTVDRTSAEYGPVHFQSRGIDVWLPQTADFLSERKGKRIHERITFHDYLLFAVDNKQEIASPKLPEQTPNSSPRQKKDWLDVKRQFTGDIAGNVVVD
jgi:tetratricopeptide (TPR) repeat protein